MENKGFSEKEMKYFQAIVLPKLQISEVIKNELKKNGYTFRDFADTVDDFSYTQLSRVTSSGNYTIETLLKVLYGLNYEIVLRKRENQ
jgi:HTH-type transcriptional regulator / antitoxin HipB